MTTLAIDLGTSAIKFLRMDDNTRVHSIDRVTHDTLDVDAWVKALRTNLHDRGDAARIERISVTGQMHGLVTLENDGYGPGVAWTDRRGEAVLPHLIEQLDPAHVSRIGGPLASGFQAVSLAWIRAHEPDRWTRIRKVMLPKDALIHALTGEHVTDPSDAAGTGMLDIASDDWACDVVDAAGVPHDWLPRILPSGSQIGTVRSDIATSLGLRQGTPVIIAGGDAPVGAFGAGATHEGDALVLLSSGAQVLMPSTDYAPDPAGRWYTWPAASLKRANHASFLRSGTLLNAGNAISWLGDILHDPDGIAPEPTQLVALPHLIGERGNAQARGTILGLGPETTGKDIRRAMLEGVAFGLRDLLEMMTESSAPTRILVGGGGASIPAWPGIIANVLSDTVGRITTHELSALGAAALAMKKTLHPDIDAEIEPDSSLVHQYDERYAIYREALEATRTLNQRIADLDGAAP